MIKKESKIFSLEKELEDSILSFHHKMIGELHKEAAKRHITTSQLEVMRYVGEKKNPTMKDIARHLNITPPSVTAIIEFLCKKKLLKREFDKSDHRIIRIMITPEAWKFFSSFKDKKLNILKNLFLKLCSHDKKELIRILSVVSK